MNSLSACLKSPLSIAVLASGAVACLFTLRRALKRKPGRRIANYQKDMVYLFGFPSCRTIVSVSPFALKLETWLRLHRIRYTAVRRSFHTWSSKGQIPFIELNGEEIGESNLIIAKLADHFGIDEELTDEQLGCARGLEMMLENQTAFSYLYYRFVLDVPRFLDTWESIGWLKRKIMAFMFPRIFRRKTYYHGIGRNTETEMFAMGCEDILALSRVLGKQRFLLGNRLTTLDCYAFGHLAQVLYDTVEYPHKRFMRNRTPNLCDYVDRVREQLWPDWRQVCVENLQGCELV